MKRFFNKRSRMFMLALVALAACGDNLIADPSFDLWCGDSLCKPWKVSGKVSRVKTWHEHDYGASFGKGAVLSQLSKHDRVDCIEFDVIADVSATADMWLEMDFLDDGSSEYKQQIAESHFAKLRYLVKTPTWYEGVRFILRKKGSGRAVLAQIRATPSDECKGDALLLLDRPDGAACEQSVQCMSGVCGEAPALFAEGYDTDDDGKPRMTCGACSKAEPCAKGQTCGASLSKDGVFGACIANGSLESGRWCVDQKQCESELCSAPTGVTHRTCAQCESDDDCAKDEVCGVEQAASGLARTCHGKIERGLGDLCAVDAECESGVCCGGACSECCNDAHACKGNTKCGGAFPEWLTVEAALCDPGNGVRDKGETCTADEDCASGECKEPKAVCQLCVGSGCDSMSTEDCGFLRRLAGTCR